MIEESHGMKIGVIEEVAYLMGSIDAEQLKAIAESLSKRVYGKYLPKVN